MGGPELFSGRSLGETHDNLAITEEAFDAVVEHLVITLHDLGVEAADTDQVRATLALQREVIVTA